MFIGAGAAGLLALPSSTRSPDARPGALRFAASLGELRATPPGVGMMLYDGAVFRWMPGDHSGSPLGPADDRTVVRQSDTPLAVGAWVRQSGAISVETFGAAPGADASPTVNAHAFQDAIAAAAISGLPLALSGGTYHLDASARINFARTGLNIIGGGSVLQFTGRGRAFVLDHGGEDGNFLEGMLVENLVIVGGPGISDGFYSRGVVRSSFYNIEVRTVFGKAFHLRHAVSNHYDGLKYSPPPNAPVTATHGLYADNDGPGYFSADCVFTNMVMEDFPGIGCQLADAAGMVFTGGTVEGCDVGLVVSSSSDDNLFIKLWAEANRSSDIVVSGNANGFIGVKVISATAEANVRILDDAHGAWFNGGYIRSVRIARAAGGTSFLQVGVDENRSGTIGFQGEGAFTRIACTKVDGANAVVGRYDDILGPVAAIGDGGRWTPVLRASRGRISTRADLTQGSYQRIGNLVFAQCFLYVDAVQGADGELFVDGLPFVPGARQPGVVHATQLVDSAAGALQARADPGARRVFMSLVTDGSAQPCARHVARDTTLAISLTYLTPD